MNEISESEIQSDLLEKSNTLPSKNMNTKWKCQYCSRSYELKKNYKNHLLSCELFHQIHTQTQDEFTEENENVPDIKTLFRYVKELASKCNRLEKEVVFLRASLGKKQQKNIMNCLNASHLPYKHFIEWYSEFKIHLEDLLTVFKEDLIVGMKHVLQKYIHTEKILPIAAFTNKPNSLYIYVYNEIAQKSEWRLMHTDDLSMFIYTFNRMFIVEFTKWQKENKDLIESNEKMKDTEIHYMIKVNGMSLTNEKKMTEIKRWLFLELAKDIEFIEFV